MRSRESLIKEVLELRELCYKNNTLKNNEKSLEEMMKALPPGHCARKQYERFLEIVRNWEQ